MEWSGNEVTFSLLPRQTREEGKSLLQEVMKLKALQDSSCKHGAMEDLGSLDLAQELSPIT